MLKKIILIPSIIAMAIFLSGCSLGSTALVPSKGNAVANATIMRSDDGGGTWNPKIKIDDKKNITGIDVLSMAISPADPNIVYIGTMSSGLFVSKNSGESWTAVAFPDKTYGLVFDPRNAEVMFGSGILNGRAKIFKRLAEGQEWKEIYTEPADGTVISSLAIDNVNPSVLYAGTSNGVIVKTTDGGQTWVNLKIGQDINAPITSIVFDQANDQHIFFGIFQVGILETKNAGSTIENITDKIDTKGNTSSVFTLTSDPYLPGVVYAGTGTGIFRRNGDGSWSSLNLIESSKAFPVRSIAINPKNSKEIMYSSAKAIYKSTDSGNKWSTFQLDTSKEISILKYNNVDPTRIYSGLRSF
jgi:photosystem II stability/assembly factor-like uncharacterized protein